MKNGAKTKMELTDNVVEEEEHRHTRCLILMQCSPSPLTLDDSCQRLNPTFDDAHRVVNFVIIIIMQSIIMIDKNKVGV